MCIFVGIIIEGVKKSSCTPAIDTNYVHMIICRYEEVPLLPAKIKVFLSISDSAYVFVAGNSDQSIQII